MQHLSYLALFVGVGLGFATPLAAQTADFHPSDARPAIFEVGGGFVMGASFDGVPGLPELHARAQIHGFVEIDSIALLR